MSVIRNKNVLLTSIGFFLIFFGFGAAQQFVIPIFGTFGGELVALTSLIIVYAFFAIGTSFAPKIISIIGSKSSFLLSSFFYSVFILSLFLRNEFLLYLFSAILGIFAAVIWTNVGSYIINAVGRKERGEALGFQTSLFILGNLAGIASTTFLLNFVTTQDIFLVLAGVSMIGLVPFLGIKNMQTKIERRSFSDVSKTFLNIKVLLLVPVILFTFFTWGQIYSSINLVVGESFGLSYVGIVGILFQIVFLLSAYILGALTKSFKKYYMLLVTVILSLTGISLFLTQPNLIIAMISVVLISLHVSTGFPVSLNLMKDVSRKDSETTSGSFNLLNSVGILSSLFSVAIFKEIVSLELAIIIGVISLISLLFLSRKI